MLKLTYSAVMMWLAVSVMLALMPNATVAASRGSGRSPTYSVEWSMLSWLRLLCLLCSRPAEHGDHFYPWSEGGSTSLQNFVAACARCNRTKGARIPRRASRRG
jgi:5-methylcytosine-specific restriction endonuclease McrA